MSSPVPSSEGKWHVSRLRGWRQMEGQMSHFWGSELTWGPMDAGRHHRPDDAVNALWGFLDMTPDGRERFMPIDPARALELQGRE